MKNGDLPAMPMDSESAVKAEEGFNCDSGANIHSNRESAWFDPVDELGLDEGERIMKELYYIEHAHGMTKRQYFAAMAMQGLLASGKFIVSDELAEESVNAADCILMGLEDGR
jgi:hypothetical protein